MDYPVFRKNSTGKSAYKIISEKEFIEKQKIGDKVLEHTVIANQYPEMLLIQDMIQCHNNLFSIIIETEYNNF